MARTLKLVVAYDGTAFHGWQRQPEARTVEATLWSALQGCSASAERLQGASRTDQGVHALGQAVSVEVDSPIPTERLAGVLNGRLPGDVRVVRVEEAAAGFHARHDATGKRYRYNIDLGEVPNVLRARYALHYPYHLDLEAMQDAALALLGEHDFASFQCASNQGDMSTVRSLSRIRLIRVGAELGIEVEGRSFLYKMVRTLAGTLVEVGRGRWGAAHVREVLEARDRRSAGPTLPGYGLCLEEVYYGETLPEGADLGP